MTLRAFTEIDKLSPLKTPLRCLTVLWLLPTELHPHARLQTTSIDTQVPRLFISNEQCALPILTDLDRFWTRKINKHPPQFLICARACRTFDQLPCTFVHWPTLAPMKLPFHLHSHSSRSFRRFTSKKWPCEQWKSLMSTGESGLRARCPEQLWHRNFLRGFYRTYFLCHINNLAGQLKACPTPLSCSKHIYSFITNIVVVGIPNSPR